jgi:hypothetical protein
MNYNKFPHNITKYHEFSRDTRKFTKHCEMVELYNEWLPKKLTKIHFLVFRELRG